MKVEGLEQDRQGRDMNKKGNYPGQANTRYSNY
jgi:hypothetical protein